MEDGVAPAFDRVFDEFLIKGPGARHLARSYLSADPRENVMSPMLARANTRFAFVVTHASRARVRGAKDSA